jgi:hypothetical protein
MLVYVIDTREVCALAEGRPGLFTKSGALSKRANSQDRCSPLARGSRRGIMVRRDRESGRMTDPAALAVLAAFDAAQDAGLSAVACYRAGVEAWRHSHPNQTEPTHRPCRGGALSV